MSSPFPLIATRSPVTKTIPLNQLPVGAGGLALHDASGANVSAILEEAQTNANNALVNYQENLNNVASGTRIDVICVEGVLPPRPSDRTDISFRVFMSPSWLPPGGEPDFAGEGYLNMDSWVKTDFVRDA